MKDARKVAIARFVLRNKEHLAAIRPMDDVLTMATMRFQDEVTKPEDLGPDLFAEKPAKPDERELEMAKRLIESLSTDFEPDKYRDEYREELLAMLERKADGKEVVSAVSEEPKPTKAPDLMAALEESLAAVRGEGERAGAGASDSNGGGSKTKAPAKSKSTSTRKRSSTGSKSSGAKSSSASKSKPKSRTKAGSK
jgi:DNA end-binding protein Ku